MSKTDKDRPLKAVLKDLNVKFGTDDENEDEPVTAPGDVRTNNHGQAKRRRRWSTKRRRQRDRRVKYLARVSIDKDTIDDERITADLRHVGPKCPRYLSNVAA